MINEKKFSSRKKDNPHILRKLPWTFFFFWAEGQDLILKVHSEEKKKYLMELKPRVTLLIKIGTSQKFNIKVIINEILVLKVVCRLNLFFWDLLHMVRTFFFPYLTVNQARSFPERTAPLLVGKRKFYDTNVNNAICATFCDCAYEVWNPYVLPPVFHF